MKLRYERKYLVPNYQLAALRERVLTFVKPDKYALYDHNIFPEYTVRSIYFDTPSLSSLFDKNEGYKDRKKLRVRGYNNQNEHSKVFLEIKRKNGDRIFKNRSLIPFKSLNKILEFGLGEKITENLDKSNQKEDAIKFLYQMNRYHQTPVNLVVYEREPYYGKFDKGTRITFDKNIRSKRYPNLSELYSDFDLNYVWKEHFILEIKYFYAPMPIWAKSIVNEFKLQSAPLSKYVEGYYCNDLKSQAIV